MLTLQLLFFQMFCKMIVFLVGITEKYIGYSNIALPKPPYTKHI